MGFYDYVGITFALAGVIGIGVGLLYGIDEVVQRNIADIRVIGTLVVLLTAEFAAACILNHYKAEFFKGTTVCVLGLLLGLIFSGPSLWGFTELFGFIKQYREDRKATRLR
ncbi:MAG TPA: hypothetical protein VFQ60_04515 [Patescibacteria group bacterium]|nr:hypothetical protein [Patescibacteria group bacterium]